MRCSLLALLVFVLSCTLKPAGQPIELDIDPSLRTPVLAAAKTWNRWVGCQLFVEGTSFEKAWGIVPGGEKPGVASTYYKLHLVRINGVPTQQCQYEAFVHELGHFIDAEAGFDPPPHTDGIMSKDWHCTYVNEPRPVWPPSDLSRAKARCQP